MNILRTNYELPVGKDFITPYWFLGFVEGVKKKKENIFSFFCTTLRCIQRVPSLCFKERINHLHLV